MTQSIINQHAALLRAASFAARAHHGQFRKDGETPYASHPFRVCLVVRDVFGVTDQRVLIAALLHDVIEDTTIDFDDVAEEFGPEIAQWVALLSKDKRKEEDEREAKYMKKLKNAPWQVKVCKLADVFDNLMDLPNLSAEQQAKGLRRKQSYYEALAENPPPEIAKPLQLVQQLLCELKL